MPYQIVRVKPISLITNDFHIEQEEDTINRDFLNKQGRYTGYKNFYIP